MSTSADDSAVMVCVDGSPASDASVRRAAASRSASPGCQRIVGEVVMSNQYSEHISEATLLDGDLVSLRRLDSDDLDGIVALSETLTESERYFRFFTAYPAYLENWARALTERSTTQFALGAFESGRLIGLASYSMCDEPGCAEVAIVVAHQEHMRGVGTGLLGRLGQIAG
jgi:hypothetical protein